MINETPMQIAQKVVDNLDTEGKFTVSITPPGFINIRISNEWLAEEFLKMYNATNQSPPR